GGGPLEAKSIAVLAALYSTAQAPVVPEQLLADPAAFSHEPPPSSSVADKLQRWFDGQWNNLNLAVIDELATPDFEFDMESGVVGGIAEMKERVLKFRESFGEFDFVVEEVWELGDAVAVRWRVAMTQIGPWLDLAATGKRAVVQGSSWAQLKDSKFARA